MESSTDWNNSNISIETKIDSENNIQRHFIRLKQESDNSELQTGDELVVLDDTLVHGHVSGDTLRNLLDCCINKEIIIIIRRQHEERLGIMEYEYIELKITQYPLGGKGPTDSTHTVWEMVGTVCSKLGIATITRIKYIATDPNTYNIFYPQSRQYLIDDAHKLQLRTMNVPKDHKYEFKIIEYAVEELELHGTEKDSGPDSLVSIQNVDSMYLVSAKGASNIVMKNPYEGKSYHDLKRPSSITFILRLYATEKFVLESAKFRGRYLGAHNGDICLIKKGLHAWEEEDLPNDIMFRRVT